MTGPVGRGYRREGRGKIGRWGYRTRRETDTGEIDDGTILAGTGVEDGPVEGNLPPRQSTTLGMAVIVARWATLQRFDPLGQIA